MEPVKFSPTDGLSYNPNQEIYWDEAALRKEIDRVFEICHSCRMCFKYCDAFPTLFDFIDKDNLSIRDFDEKQIEAIAERCFQCKICYFKCPYTDRDKHEFNLDFPRLIMRYKAIKAKHKGIPWRDRLLGNPDLIGQIGCSTAGLANWANQNSANRIIMENTLGISKEKKLPSFAPEKFYNWYQKNKLKYSIKPEEVKDRVVLFYTCFGNYNNTTIAKDALFVLWKNKIQVEIPHLNCCGMPALESGNINFARTEAENNYKILIPYIQQGYKVLVLNPTCSLTMKEEYKILLENKYAAADLELFSKAIFDTNEYLFSLKRDDKFDRSFQSTPGKVIYHVACHLRAQNIGYRSRDMMKTIQGTSFILVEECCGHNGTWAMKKEFFKDSIRIGAKVFDQVKANEHNLIASDCPLAAIQIEQGTGEPVLHTIQVLARAYREDGFNQKLKTEE